MLRVVNTMTQRLTNEWKHSSFEEELKQDDGKKYTAYPYEVGGSLYESRAACSLLKVHWLRLIVDEGHSMGRGTNNSAYLHPGSWLNGAGQ